MKRSGLTLFSHKREPENGTKPSVLKKRVRILAAAVVLAATAAVSLVLPQAGYAVSLNGQIVGAVKNAGEVNEIIDEVERQVSDILGYEYVLDGTVELTGGAAVGESADLTEAFMNSVTEIEMAYVLEIDGKAAAAATDEAAVREAIERISEMYSVSAGSSVGFDNRVAITFDYAPADIIMTADEIVEILDPKGGAAETALTVRTLTKETHCEEVPYETVYIDDPTVYEGTETVLQTGIPGSADVTEQVIYLNGEETERSELYTIVTLQPVEEKISVGTMFRPRYVSYGEYIWPAEGIITCGFGYRDIGVGSNDHRGLDIGGYYRSNILAADGGEVIFAGNVYSYGNLVKIQHDNGDVTWYAHCDEIIVSVGDKVAQGDTIAYMGTTGVSTGVHLHFEVHTGGVAVDPLTVLP